MTDDDGLCLLLAAVVERARADAEWLSEYGHREALCASMNARRRRMTLNVMDPHEFLYSIGAKL